MRRVLLLGVSLLLSLTLAQGLVCNVCKFKVGSLCFHRKDPCLVMDGQCEVIKAYIGHVKLFSKSGCTTNESMAQCNRTQQHDSIFDINYNRTCCPHDLCNGASPSSSTPPTRLLLAGLASTLTAALLL
ncbi:lymphocyte antigen 6 complex locus protein G6c [Alligator mississippiensis]|uniref:Lymphocyte antigen 6 complex locus protein G6c n=1 Tax=Alligator mississippiensis TaxID=8496 RepID=A0A151M3P9_ALLMI|nr:lymphocyte antigen 6 complex locus protein G6c [Alligator mississippiensis]